MKVFLRPPKHLSLAMFRVAAAIEDTRPPDIEIVSTEDEADLLVLHVISQDAVEYRRDKPCAVLQYCLHTGGSIEAWQPLWDRALAVWSYYDLEAHISSDKFYYGPMGVGSCFVEGRFKHLERKLGVLTSGYVTGPGAEAIEEMTVACRLAGKESIHLGPRPVGMKPTTPCQVTGLISDGSLASLYHQVQYVSGLRYVEGFEMPALEGLSCGARPIMFDRPDAHQWFDGHAYFVKECHGDELIDLLVPVLTQAPTPVGTNERVEVLIRFDWDRLCNEFWRRILNGVERAKTSMGR